MGRGSKALDKIADSFRKKKRGSTKIKVGRVNPADVWEKMEGAKPSFSIDHDTFARRVRKRLLSKSNYGESAAARMLQAISATYEREKPFQVKGNLFFADFFVLRIPVSGGVKMVNTVLEIDGSVHDLDDVRKKDRFKNKTLIRHPEVRAILRIRVDDLRHMERAELRTAMASLNDGDVVIFRRTALELPA